MRMIDVNIFNTDKTMRQAKEKGARKYFCVSTDKATNPVNMMGASKRIMEMFLMRLLSQENSRQDMSKIITDAGYNISVESKRLEQKYIELYRRTYYG